MLRSNRLGVPFELIDAEQLRPQRRFLDGGGRVAIAVMRGEPGQQSPYKLGY
jgi:hypothetical protein